MERLFEADRLDCQRALQEPQRARVIPASENFMSLQWLLESQQLPMDNNATAAEQPWNSGIADTLQDFCLESEKEAGQSSKQVEQISKCSPTNIVEQILRDFCSSPSYLDDASPKYNTHPDFRFYNKQIRTYSRPSKKQVNVVLDDDEERLSCSSGLSMQEDFITQMPTTKHCDFDANSSQLICENLLNLSAFFTQNQVQSCSSIDLPKDEGQAAAMIMEEPQDAEDILKDNGYCIGNTEECRLLDDNDAVRVEVTNLLPNVNGVNQEDAKETCNNEFLDDIPFSEWQPIELPNTSVELPKPAAKHMDFNVCDQLEEIPISEWQPMFIPETASQKPNEASEEQLNSSQEFKVTPGVIEFRTASNKTVELTEEMRKKAAMLMADLKCPEETEHPNNQAETFPAFKTASNKTLKMTAEMEKRAAMLMADLSALQDEPKVENQLETMSGFRTASNKMLKLTEEMQKKASMLMADINCNNSQIPTASNTNNKRRLGAMDTKIENIKKETLDKIPLSQWQPMELNLVQKIEIAQQTNDVSSQLDMIPLSEWQHVDLADSVEFRTASNKLIEVSDEHQQKASTLMATVATELSEICDRNAPAVQVHLEQVQFRTASNKALEVTEEMRQRAAMLMADLEAIQNTNNLLDEMQSKEFESNHILEDAEYGSASRNTIKMSTEIEEATKILSADIEVVNSAMPIGSGNRKSNRRKCIPIIKDDMEENSTTLKEESNRKQENVSRISKDSSNINTLTPSEHDNKRNGDTVNRLNTRDPFEDGHRNTDSRQDFLCLATPHPSKLADNGNLAFETPKCTPESQVSLTHLTELSPLDTATKSSIITRRNLLSLNKRRKLRKDVENMDATQTPARQRFNPMKTATSTPMPSRQEHSQQPLEDVQCSIQKERRFSQDSPRVQRERVGKRRSEEALSPIYAPTNKSRRLGLSRIRNKSSNNI
ncbi:breast cancer type 2 susceptibility protein homolog isoform X2 [Drosophila sulfurigaster albostrigata]|uniref:breast cancer type 2 susceptibility protein homolog isoform X2 n=1 Tax=Drosophila sulfurigaster albostrigata TaxID=89887 RepID=UPI002D21839B|nr:breast cancer type 2 susceptibility protein homolog isoform X2 [Drosophila sulfurigaster albostrigata]